MNGRRIQRQIGTTGFRAAHLIRRKAKKVTFQRNMQLYKIAAFCADQLYAGQNEQAVPAVFCCAQPIGQTGFNFHQ